MEEQKMPVYHLRYDYMEAGLGCGLNEHAQEGMKRLGITYQHSTPQSMGDQYWFWNCENVPEELPSYLTPLGVDPYDAIGYGLSKELADMIANETAKREKIRLNT